MLAQRTLKGQPILVLQGVRLPENNGEWGDVQATLEGVRPAFKADSSPAALLNELMTLAVECADWWNSRNRSSGAPRLLCCHVQSLAGRPSWSWSCVMCRGTATGCACTAVL
jgi:hypothetical protein